MVQTAKKGYKFPTRILGVSTSTANSFVFLELGVLPIEFEIDKRKMMYLHRILNLEDSDPVHKMFRNQQSFSEAGEENWWSGVQELLQKYNISMTLEEIKSVSKPRFRWVVKTAIEQFTHFRHKMINCLDLFSRDQ